MRDEITSLDLRALTHELAVLEGARIDKIYQRDRDLTINAYKPGDKKYRLFLAPGKVFLTRYKRDNPTKPPNFCMYLRKHLSGKDIVSVDQHGFDRVLTIQAQEKTLVAEIFGKGNIIVFNNDDKTIAAVQDPQEWSSRSLYRGETYQFPEVDVEPAKMTEREFKQMLGSRQIVKVLAAEIGVGGVYAEEILSRANVEKSQRSDSLEEEQAMEVYRQLDEILTEVDSGALSPRIYTNGDRPVDVSPIKLQQYSSYEEKKFEDFSEALDTYFTERQKAAYRQKKEEAYRKKKEKLEGMKKEQEQMLEGVEESITEKKEIADAIYENYGTVEEVIETIRAIRNQYSEVEIQERLESEKAEGVRTAQVIEDLNLGAGNVMVDLGAFTAKINIDEDVEQNAERYYQKSKEAKRKFKGAQEALEETERKLEELEQNKDEIDVGSAFTDKEAKRKKKRWYEKFRWCISSDGFLIVGGRDATSNEILVKKHMDDNDVYVHADFEGAPSVVVKNEQDDEIPESTLEEAGKLAVTYSKAWKLKIGGDDAYWVEPEQVTKNPESGEYLGKGAFVIRGERNYMKNLSTSAAVGLYERDGNRIVMGGPEGAVKDNCKSYVIVAPGNNKKSETAKEIKDHLDAQLNTSCDLDTVIRSLPPGTCRITGKH